MYYPSHNQLPTFKGMAAAPSSDSLNDQRQSYYPQQTNAIGNSTANPIHLNQENNPSQHNLNSLHHQSTNSSIAPTSGNNNTIPTSTSNQPYQLHHVNASLFENPNSTVDSNVFVSLFFFFGFWLFVFDFELFFMLLFFFLFYFILYFFYYFIGDTVFVHAASYDSLPLTTLFQVTNLSFHDYLGPEASAAISTVTKSSAPAQSSELSASAAAYSTPSCSC